MVARAGNTQASLCSLERGLYTLRFKSSDVTAAPVADVRVLAGPISIVRAPGATQTGQMLQGQAIVLIAEAPGIIEITLSVSIGSSLPQGSFSLDLLDRGFESASINSTNTSPTVLPGDEEKQSDNVAFEIEAHVSRIGDIRVVNGAWIAGPGCPLPIEGLTLVEGQQYVGVEMQVRSVADIWSPWLGPGQFLGSRQRAEHLTGIRFKVMEARVADRTIIAQALFLGASVSQKQGTFLEFSSQDPLVGLKVDVVRKKSTDLTLENAATSKVKVFRAR